MRGLTLVAILLFMGGLLFAAGPQMGFGTQGQQQAKTGDCDGTPDQTRDQDQLRDGSCQDLTGTIVNMGAVQLFGTQDRDHDRLRDGTGDGVPDQDRIGQHWR